VSPSILVEPRAVPATPAPPPTAARAQRPEGQRVFLYLLLPAFLLRVLNVALCGSDPIVCYPVQDGLAYVRWAAQIVAGDWLGLERPVFYQSPLHPYVLAVLQQLGLGFYPWPHLLNALAGTATVLLIFLTTRRLFEARAAWIAGAASALWGPALVYECSYDKTSLSLFVVAAALQALIVLHDRLRDAGRLRALALGAGLLLGAGALLRENLLILAPVAALFLVWRSRRIEAAAWLLLGALIGVTPSFAHNLIVGGELMPTTYQAGTNLWIGNHEAADGTYEALLPGRGDPIHEETDARRLAAEALGAPPAKVRASAVNRYWIGQALHWAGTHPIDWAALQLRKLQWFCYHAEAPDSVAYDACRTGRPWLLPSRLLFGLLLPLALVGFLVTGHDSRVRFLAILALVACGSVIAFFVVGRYRLACLPFLLPFAASGALAIVARPTWLVAALLAAVPAQVWLPARPPAGLDRVEQTLLMEVNRATAVGIWSRDPRLAIERFERVLALSPDLLAAHQGLARLHMDPGGADYTRALPHCEAAVRLAPLDVQARHNLGFCLLQLGRLERAEHELGLALQAAGKDPPAITVEQLARCRERLQARR
jgi:4-amino-4-deoxy-L-arabinose transferase-like glycosyltransferase